MDIKYDIAHRHIKYPRLEFRTGMLKLILPYGRNPMEIIRRHADWIRRKEAEIKVCISRAEKTGLIERTNGELEELIRSLAKRNACRLGVKIGRIRLRRMKTKWASCNSRGNLGFNILMSYLPDSLIDYIVYHELTHILVMNHGEKFKKIIGKRYADYARQEQKLHSYWFLINKKDISNFVLDN